jgi:C-3',4' desaturase CrtD
MANKQARIIVIGAGVGGLTTAALLAQAGHDVTVLEAQTYPGGCAGTFFHKGYRFEAGATVAGGFQPGGPHAIVADKLGITFPVRLHDPAWVVHLPDCSVKLTRDNADVINTFPHTARFWDEQSGLADICWRMSGQGLPFPPTDLRELGWLAGTALRNFPQDVRIAPFALMTAHDWLRWRGVADDPSFVRFIDAQLLIAAQTTSRHANAIYSATALDLARQGVYHVEGGIGGLAETLVKAVEGYGGRVLYRRRVKRIVMENGRAVAVEAEQRRQTERYDADFVVGNLTPWSLDELLGEDSPRGLKRETQSLRKGWGAFVLHLGVRADAFPHDFPDHHQVLASVDQPLGEGRSIFMSISPEWDSSRAPTGHRAMTITTHTEVTQWWDLLQRDENAYHARKADYSDKMLTLVERVLPGFRQHIALHLPGTPVTYRFYTDRHLGMVGGFPQESLFKARSQLTGVANVRLVGDSIFPGQSTAGVSLGALRVAADVLARVGNPHPRPLSLMERDVKTPSPLDGRAEARPYTSDVAVRTPFMASTVSTKDEPASEMEAS